MVATRLKVIGLERRSARRRDNIDHAPGAHDDIADVMAGVLVLAAGVGSDRFNSKEWVAAWGGAEVTRMLARARGQW